MKLQYKFENNRVIEYSFKPPFWKINKYQEIIYYVKPGDHDINVWWYYEDGTPLSVSKVHKVNEAINQYNFNKFIKEIWNS